MKYFLFAAMLIFVSNSTTAQNLVPNPSFEDTLICPEMNQWWTVADWVCVENTCDYYNKCVVLPNSYGVPINKAGPQDAASGHAYLGICTYVKWTQFREKATVPLTEPLEVGISYYVSFKAVASNSHNIGMSGASSKTGVRFSTVQYDLDQPPPTDNFCHVWTDSIISDTVNWTVFKGSFTADSPYTHLTIGNFFDNANTDTSRYWFLDGTDNGLQCYQFIDDVCVTTDSAGCMFYTNAVDVVEQDGVPLYPNPASNVLVVTGKYRRFILTNIFGQTVYVQPPTFGERSVKIDVANFPNGTYLIIFENEHLERLIQKITIIH